MANTKEVKGTALLKFRDAVFEQDPIKLSEVVNEAWKAFDWDAEFKEQFITLLSMGTDRRHPDKVWRFRKESVTA